MKKLVMNLLAIALVASVAWFVWNGGLRGVRVPTSPPPVPSLQGLANLGGHGGPDNRQLVSILSQSGVEVRASEARGSGVELTLQWPAGNADLADRALRQARESRVIRSFTATGPGNLDTRQLGGRTYYLGRYLVQY